MKIEDKKKRKAVEHVVYEIMMFKATNLLLLSNINEQVSKNVLLESFAVHSRNLFDFFYKKRINDDIVAIDFIGNKAQFRKDKSKKRNMQTLARKANKQISHLTYSRNNYNSRTKPWNISSIGAQMNKTIEAFFKSLDIEKKVWFNKELKKWNYPILL